MALNKLEIHGSNLKSMALNKLEFHGFKLSGVQCILE